jgi:hypothetical protein
VVPYLTPTALGAIVAMCFTMDIAAKRARGKTFWRKMKDILRELMQRSFIRFLHRCSRRHSEGIDSFDSSEVSLLLDVVADEILPADEIFPMNQRRESSDG